MTETFLPLKHDFSEHWIVPLVMHLQLLQLSPLAKISPLMYPSSRCTQSEMKKKIIIIKQYPCIVPYKKKF